MAKYVQIQIQVGNNKNLNKFSYLQNDIFSCQY